MKRRDKVTIAHVMAHPGWYAGRVMTFVLIMGALGLMVLSRVQPDMVAPLRERTGDAFAPVLAVMSHPADAISAFAAGLRHRLFVYTENAALREENARLRAWADAAMALELRNRQLERLTGFVADPQPETIAARVIADGGGAFARSVLVTAGTRDGVVDDAAVVTGNGLAGRISDAGRHSAQVLLLSDINSRIPVVLAQSRVQGIAAGSNRTLLKLEHFPPDAAIEVGERVMTSGFGGMFPPGLPVGVIISRAGGYVTIQPFADLSRLDLVSIIVPPALNDDAAVAAPSASIEGAATTAPKAPPEPEAAIAPVVPGPAE